MNYFFPHIHYSNSREVADFQDKQKVFWYWSQGDIPHNRLAIQAAILEDGRLESLAHIYHQMLVSGNSGNTYCVILIARDGVGYDDLASAPAKYNYLLSFHAVKPHHMVALRIMEMRNDAKLKHLIDYAPSNERGMDGAKFPIDEEPSEARLLANTELETVFDRKLQEQQAYNKDAKGKGKTNTQNFPQGTHAFAGMTDQRTDWGTFGPGYDTSGKPQGYWQRSFVGWDQGHTAPSHNITSWNEIRGSETGVSDYAPNGFGWDQHNNCWLRKQHESKPPDWTFASHRQDSPHGSSLASDAPYDFSKGKGKQQAGRMKGTGRTTEEYEETCWGPLRGWEEQGFHTVGKGGSQGMCKGSENGYTRWESTRWDAVWNRDDKPYGYDHDHLFLEAFMNFPR